MCVSCPDVPAQACRTFNQDARATVAALLRGEHASCPGRRYTGRELAAWVLTEEQISKLRLGDLLGRRDESAAAVLSAFVAALDLRALRLDDALRFFLSLFRLPGEAQMIGRIMEAFAARYATQHADTPLGSADTVYVLSYALIMLNVDAHSAAVTHKMTQHQFAAGLRGVDGGADLPAPLLAELYASICGREIVMEQREYISSKVEGWLCKRGGRVPSWKRRYFILSGSCLYYFTSPKDAAPLGIVPLEGVEVRPTSRSQASFEVRPAALPGAQAGPRHVRSVRASSYRPGGALVEQGHHASFRFRAASAAERQRWVDAIREHSVGDPMAGVRATLSRHKSGRWAASSGEKVAAPPARAVV